MSSRPGHKGGTPLEIPPDKLFFKIGEVARIAGVAPYVLRYWESEFPQLKPRKGAGGQRVYRREDLGLVLAIRHLLHQEGFTIAGARKHLKGETIAASEAAAEPEAPPPSGDAVRNAREGLRELLDIMDNTDASRADAQSDSGRGAVR